LQCSNGVRNEWWGQRTHWAHYL